VTFALRLADKSDLARIADIHWSARADTMPWLRVVYNFDKTIVWLRDSVLPHQHVTVAGRDGIIAGYCATSGSWIEHIYIEKSFSRQGAGSLLLEEAVTRLVRPIQIYVFQKNTSARAFYERRGFEAVTFGDGLCNEEREPDVRYVLA
jgi:ribosomal protein S18 acetylase RimI-like enzyme